MGFGPTRPVLHHRLGLLVDRLYVDRVQIESASTIVVAAGGGNAVDLRIPAGLSGGHTTRDSFAALPRPCVEGSHLP